MKHEPAISVAHLVQQHPFAAGLTLDDISVEIPKHRLTVVLGENGCGKSTLLNCIAGIIPFSSGTIDVSINSHAAYRLTGGSAPRLPAKTRCMMGIVFQQKGLWPHFTVRENLQHPLRLVHKITSDEEVAARVDKYLDKLGLSRGILDQYPSELSGGEQRKVAIARTLAIEPELLIIDELEANLDQPSLERVLEIIDDEFVSAKKTVVMICHRPDVIERFVPFVVVLHPRNPDGDRVVTAQSMHELFQRIHGAPAMRKYIASVSEPPRQLSFRDHCLAAAFHISSLMLRERDEGQLFQRLGEQISALIAKLDPEAVHLLLIATRIEKGEMVRRAEATPGFVPDARHAELMATRPEKDYMIRSAEVTPGFVLDGKHAHKLRPISKAAVHLPDGRVAEYQLQDRYRDIIREQRGVSLSAGGSGHNGLIDWIFAEGWDVWGYRESEHSELVKGAYWLGIPIPDDRGIEKASYNEFSTLTKHVYMIAIQVDDEVKGIISIDTTARRRWSNVVMRQLVVIANMAAIAIKQLENDRRDPTPPASS